MTGRTSLIGASSAPLDKCDGLLAVHTRASGLKLLPVKLDGKGRANARLFGMEVVSPAGVISTLINMPGLARGKKPYALLLNHDPSYGIRSVPIEVTEDLRQEALSYGKSAFTPYGILSVLQGIPRVVESILPFGLPRSPWPMDVLDWAFVVDLKVRKNSSRRRAF